MLLCDKELDLTRIMKNHHWHIQSCSVKSGKGLKDGFTWLKSCKKYYDYHVETESNTTWFCEEDISY